MGKITSSREQLGKELVARSSIGPTALSAAEGPSHARIGEGERRGSWLCVAAEVFSQTSWTDSEGGAESRC